MGFPQCEFITDPIEKAISLKLLLCDYNNTQIQLTESGKPFTISINIIRKRLSSIERKQSIGPDDIPGEKFEVRQGSHNFIHREIAGYYVE